MAAEESTLAEAERHVIDAQHRIQEQLILIETLRADGHDTRLAEQLLATYLSVLDQMTAHRDILRRAEHSR